MFIEPTIVDRLLQAIILIGVVVLSFGGQIDQQLNNPSTLPQSPNEDVATVRADHVIEDVQVNVLESFPMQITLDVTGAQTDGCEFPVQVDQRREGDTVFVEIYREIPITVTCPRVPIAYNEEIAIEGTFEGGTITFDVNGFVTSIDLGGE